MINLGQILLSIPLAISAIQFFSGAFSWGFSQQRLTKWLFASLTVCFAFLTYKYVVSDFSYLNVFENSHTMKPLIYKITGVWGNHEGSMLLFIFILSLYSFLFCIFSKSKNKDNILFFQGFASFLLLAYIYFASSPFEVNSYYKEGVDIQGLGLNPLLQDIGLAIHPPLLYLGYAGFSLCFSYALVALKDNIDPQIFANEIRNYSLFSWSFLAFGIALGSWWAYRELGWGGFWFWDPVENSSLVPWLLASALIHSSIYTRKFGGYALLTVFLSLATFIFALTGFFLVRSGILSSVHSFASDPNRGLFMLAIVFILSAYSMYLFGRNLFSYHKESNYHYTILSRQVHIGINVVIFLALTITILLGLFYPIILEVFNIRSISIGEPYFEKVFLPLSILLAVVAVFTPFIKWHKNKLSKIVRALPSLVSSIVIAFVIQHYFSNIGNFALISLICGLWLFISMLELYVLRIFDDRGKITRGLNVLFLSHGGFGLLIVFITLLVTQQSKVESIISKNNAYESDAAKIELLNSEISKRDNFLYQSAKFKLELEGGQVLELNPENRVYFPDVKKTYEVDIKSDHFADYYMVMGKSEMNEEGDYEFPVRFYIKPFIMYMWLAMFMIGLGGLIALIPKRK